MIRFDPTHSVLGRFSKDLLAPNLEELTGLRPILYTHSAEDIAAAQFAWTERIVDEYHSVVVLTELLRCVVECEAPFEVLCAIHAMINDELRHVALCTQAASWFGPTSHSDINLSGLALPLSDDPPLLRALEIVVREIVVADEESITAFMAYRDATTDAALMRVLSALHRDELRHVATGAALLDMLAGMVPDTMRPEVLARLESMEAKDRNDLRRRYDATARGGPGRLLGAAIKYTDLERARAKRR
jgi:hypothetical protein